jgi:hypothetical protein
VLCKEETCLPISAALNLIFVPVLTPCPEGVCPAPRIINYGIYMEKSVQLRAPAALTTV